ncbi:MAG TPA: exosortase-dependent surface protein XDP1 [Burkholderiaceae bacterium]|nr:exosortase-dependent surface protein XDP1 [Burkholderiaceae bacterium]
MKSIRSRSNHQLHLLAACALLAMALPATAADWDLDALCTSDGNSVATGSCGSGLSISGWSTATGSVGATTSDNLFHTAKVYDWGSFGLGVVGSNEDPGATGPHATDNKYGTDAILFTFTTATSLSSVKIGWNGSDNATGTSSGAYKDSDLSVLAWTGAGAPGSLAGAAPNSAGWTLIGNYANVGLLTGNTALVAAATTFSSYWLVSAYNSSYYGNTLNGGSQDNFFDAFKVLKVSGTPTTVAEPGSLALFGLAAIGLAAARRRKAKAS